jgi:flagellar protein FlaG
MNMAISNTPMRPAEVLQPSQPVAQSVAASRTQVGGSSSRAVTAPSDAQGLLATKSAAETRASEARAETTRLSAAQTQQSLDEINKVMDALSISVQFQVDPDLDAAIIRVVDQQSGEVIRQFPSEEAVRMAKALDNLKGLLFAQAV